MTTRSAEEILSRNGIPYVSNTKGKYTTKCPGCGGGYLNVEIKRDGVVWYCAYCKDGNGEKFEHEERRESKRDPIKASFDYTDEDGNRLFQVLRFEPLNAPKYFRQRTGPDQEKWSIKGVRIVPYRLPEIIEAVSSGRPIFIVEGEKDVETLRTNRVPATCNPMGAGKWRTDFAPIFKDADVIICGDNDQIGRDHVEQVAKRLGNAPKRIRVLDLAKVWPAIEESDDITDWFKAGHSADELWVFTDDLPDWQPRPYTNGDTTTAPVAFPFLSKQEFIAGFTPPDYLINGILQRRFIYALTGQTGHAKTAVALLIAQLVAADDSNAVLGVHRVERGRVVYFVGENPDDVRMRIIGADKMRGEASKKDDIWFMPGVFNIKQIFDHLAAYLRGHGDVSLIIVDTSAAYFLGDEELSNTQMGGYARDLRRLTTLPGGPTVLVLCHPIKHVQEASQLLPRGGGAYLAEMDGNLTLWRKTEDTVELYYTKLRGPGFQPLSFRLESIPDAMRDRKDRPLSSVRAVAISPREQEQITAAKLTDEDRVLTEMLRVPHTDGGSTRAWAEALGWFYGNAENRQAHGTKVQRILDTLGHAKPPLVQRERGDRWALTERGKEVAREAGIRFMRQAEAAKQSSLF